MKKTLTLLILFAAYLSYGQEAFFRGNNNYQAPILFAPTISATSVVSNISRYGATSGATITNNGGAPILASGVCWSATSNTPTIADNKTTDGTSFGAFTSTFSGLTAGVTYNVRAYATNSVGTSYGAVQSFTTAVKTIQTAVLIGSQVWTDKNLNVANYRNGDPITYAANAAQWNAANIAGTGAFTYLKFASGDGGATYGKLYNWYAVNDARGLAPTGYHIPTQAEWTTLRGTQPGNGKTLKSNTTDWSASFSNVNNNITFIPDANYSNYNGTNSTGFNALPGGSLFPNGTNGNYGSASFWTATVDAVNSANANWTYFHPNYLYDGANCCGTYEKGNGMAIRLVKDNNVIETASPTPTLTTTTSSSISATSAVVGGAITDEGNTQVSLRGFVYGTSAGSSTYSVTTGSGAGTFTNTLTGLISGTTYFVRSFATNVQGTSYGTEINFTPTLILTTVTIGSKIWTDKNLDISNYRNGDPITFAANATDWNAATNAGIGAWCYYSWDSNNGPIYGKLYNWYAVNDPRGLAPTGYHIPTAAEYATLASNSGSSLQSTTSEWAGNIGSNTTGFTGLPGGNNDITLNNQFEDKGTSGWFWSATPNASDPTQATFRLLHQSHAFIELNYSKKYGMSVRLVKD